MTRVNRLSVATFYLTACAISWPIFWIRDKHPAVWNSWDFPVWFNKGWLPALGPFLACLLALFLFRRSHRRRITLFGTSPLRSALFIAIPWIALGWAGYGSDEPHLTGLLFGAVYIVYGFLEESGWRGFLQDALQPLPEWKRYCSIGVLWGVWHFTSFLSGTATVVALRLTMMGALWIGGSWGIGKVAERTRSLSTAAMLHLIFNLSTALPAAKLLPVLAASGLSWILLLKNWPRPQNETGDRPDSHPDDPPTIESELPA